MLIIYDAFCALLHGLITLQGYNYTAELGNLTKLRMLFQGVVMFLPILNFLKISCKRGKVQCIYTINVSNTETKDIFWLTWLSH